VKDRGGGGEVGRDKRKMGEREGGEVGSQRGKGGR